MMDEYVVMATEDTTLSYTCSIKHNIVFSERGGYIEKAELNIYHFVMCFFPLWIGYESFIFICSDCMVSITTNVVS